LVDFGEGSFLKKLWAPV